ncbi:MAG: hypothetical protein P1U67_12435 [Alcanivoracaceae bacterium]|nr:hypothetical protein [Alcanivoracaceae bacterium]
MKIRYLLCLLVFFSASSHAEWAATGVYVKKVYQFYENSNSITRVIYESAPGSTVPDGGFSCAPNSQPIPGYTNRYQAAYWSSSTSTLSSIFVGELLAAQAQGLPVDIFFEDSGCNTYAATYGYGGLGRQVKGVAVSLD